MLQRVTEEELRESFRAIDDGRSFWEHAEDAGYEPARWRECIDVLDGLVGWIEMHIEQARVLQDTGNRIGIVNAIAGYVHADVVVQGRGDHAGQPGQTQTVLLGKIDIGLIQNQGTIERFGRAEQLASYSGLVARENSSGGKIRFGAVRRDVNVYLKWAFVEAANSALLNAQRCGYDHIRRLYQRIQPRRGHGKAKVAVARHLSEASFWMLKKGEPYREPMSSTQR